MTGAGIRVQTIGIALFLSLCGGLPPRSAWAGSAAENTQEAADLEEIVVTGSHIRGVESTGSKLITIGREQIDASGYNSVEGVLSTVTQNFNRANGAVGNPRFFNYNHGAEVQLRGLGAGTTLTLVNGQR